MFSPDVLNINWIMCECSGECPLGISGGEGKIGEGQVGVLLFMKTYSGAVELVFTPETARLIVEHLLQSVFIAEQMNRPQAGFGFPTS